MSELTLAMLEADKQHPCDPAVNRYVIDRLFEDGQWYLWKNNQVIFMGSWDALLQELRRMEG